MGAWSKREVERNRAIFRDYRRGLTMREIAKLHDLSSARIHQIVRAEMDRDEKPVRLEP